MEAVHERAARRSAIDDILVHPRDNDLIIGTHGRSIWIIDDITPLQQLSEQVMTAENHVFDVRPAVAYVTDIQRAISVEGAQALPRRRTRSAARRSATC